MKKLLSVAVLLMVCLGAHAQNDVTKFLGIPVDGPKEDMIRKLTDKGFRRVGFDVDMLEGEFNGGNVYIMVGTNNDKVHRIMVKDVYNVNETDIKIRFNKLCQQFQQSPNYLALEDYTIPKDERISHEITYHKKRYQASYYQKPDEVEMANRCRSILLSKYSEEELDNPSEENRDRIQNDILYVFGDYVSKKRVWFMIEEESYGQYCILLYYDNEYNHANGEDL